MYTPLMTEGQVQRFLRAYVREMSTAQGRAKRRQRMQARGLTGDIKRDCQRDLVEWVKARHQGRPSQ